MDKDYSQFVKLIKQATGIDLSLYKEAQMKRRLTSLYTKKGFQSFMDFYSGIQQSDELLEEFLDRMTINVTEFYRNKNRWDILEKKILPRLLKENNLLKVWSAAASTGEEPYTLSMIMSNFLPFDKISVLATDIDERAIETAKLGKYTHRSLGETPNSMIEKYFHKEGAFYKIDQVIKDTVTFKKQNLLLDRFGKGFHLIVCRNVLIYFTEEAKDQLYHKFSEALAPGGVLFVGSTEQIFNPAQYGLEVEDTFFYRKI